MIMLLKDHPIQAMQYWNSMTENITFKAKIPK